MEIPVFSIEKVARLSGSIPGMHAGASVTGDGTGGALMAGGFGKSGLSNDIYSLKRGGDFANEEHWIWKRYTYDKGNSQLRPRLGHAAVLWNDRWLVIYGGEGRLGPDGQVFEENHQNNEQENVCTVNSKVRWKPTLLTSTEVFDINSGLVKKLYPYGGIAPGGRIGHTLVAGKDGILLSGGRAEDVANRMDFWWLDLSRADFTGQEVTGAAWLKLDTCSLSDKAPSSNNFTTLYLTGVSRIANINLDNDKHHYVIACQKERSKLWLLSVDSNKQLISFKCFHTIGFTHEGDQYHMSLLSVNSIGVPDFQNGFMFILSLDYLIWVKVKFLGHSLCLDEDKKIWGISGQKLYHVFVASEVWILKIKDQEDHKTETDIKRYLQGSTLIRQDRSVSGLTRNLANQERNRLLQQLAKFKSELDCAKKEIEILQQGPKP